jgi:RHS repeat-associated protein
VTEYRYDLDGDLDTVVYPSGLSLEYERDPATGRVRAVRNVASGAAYATNAAYSPAGPLRSLTFGDDSTLLQTFNLRYQPLSIASGPLALSYTPTPAGDISAIASGEHLDTFGYDFLDRLASRSSTTGVRSEALTLVHSGGRLTQALEGGTGRARYAYGYDEQTNISGVSAYDTSGATIASTICLVHDALGRLVLAGRAASASGPDAVACQSEADVQQVIARFKYDARNRRVARQDVSGEWTWFAFDPGGRLLSELAAGGGPWTPMRDYVWLEDRPLAQLEYFGGSTGRAFYFHLDHLGTPRALTNASGQAVWAATVLPNGEALESTIVDPLSGRTVVTNLRLPGQYDERLFAAAGISGLQGPYYNWNRWYLPSMGRYMELDPIALAGGFNEDFGPDWYGYAGNNPLTFVDLDALSKSKGLPGSDPAYAELKEAFRKGREYVLEVAKKWEQMYRDGAFDAKRWNKIKGWTKTAKRGDLPSFPVFLLDPCLYPAELRPGIRCANDRLFPVCDGGA